MLRRLLFETKVGDLLLACLEWLTGMGLIDLRQVGKTRASRSGRTWRIIG